MSVTPIIKFFIRDTTIASLDDLRASAKVVVSNP